MMTLYYTPGACSLIVRIIINELGIKAQYQAVNLRTKKTDNDLDYLTINAKGSVPFLQISHDQSLTENAVIIQYLAEEANATELLPKVGDFNRYRVLEWLNYIATDIHKSFSPLFNPGIPQQQLKENLLIPLLKKKFSYINSHLQDHEYLSGAHFTLPDAYLFVMLRWAVAFKLDFNEWPAINQYFKKLNQRQSIVKSLAEEA